MHYLKCSSFVFVLENQFILTEITDVFGLNSIILLGLFIHLAFAKKYIFLSCIGQDPHPHITLIPIISLFIKFLLYNLFLSCYCLVVALDQLTTNLKIHNFPNVLGQSVSLSFSNTIFFKSLSIIIYLTSNHFPKICM